LIAERLCRDGDGLVVHRLKRPFRDCTKGFLFEPLDILARLAALRPHAFGLETGRSATSSTSKADLLH
jgi:hypothetical protein